MHSSPFPLTHRLRRLLWHAVWLCLFRPSPRFAFAWRRLLLRAFGARLHPSARVYHSTRIWAPWNLVMDADSILADDADCYNVATVTLMEGAIVSQYAYLCTAGHDVHDPAFPLVTAPVTIEPGAWVAAKAVIGPGVTVGAGAVVALGAVVVKSVPAGTIVGGNPAREIGKRGGRQMLKS
jgi:putative colanic acid biosynthesis acetyltransferase WcaF